MAPPGQEAFAQCADTAVRMGSLNAQQYKQCVHQACQCALYAMPLEWVPLLLSVHGVLLVQPLQYTSRPCRVCRTCRNPRDYFAVFDIVEAVSASGSSIEHFELVCCKCVDTYVALKKNQNQICWKFTKVGVLCRQ